jgi:hypothetical protein
MITSVHYTQPAPSQAIRITMQDGTEWSTDASLPADTEIRRYLADWLAAGGQIAAYVAPPAPVPASITRRQCARELFNREMITGDEMVAMTATGTPPASIEAMFALMPDNEQWIARSDFAADTYMRDNPLLVFIMTASGATPPDIDDFFREAAAL